MEKKTYQKPATKFVAMSEQMNLLEGTVTEIDGNGPGYGGGGNGPAYAGENGVWDSDAEFDSEDEVRERNTFWDN